MAQGPGALKSPTGTVSHKLQERRGSRRSRSAGSQAQPQHGRQRQTTSGHSRRVGRTGTCETKGANSRPTNGTIPEMGIKTIEMENSTVIQTVEIFKRPGQSLGFYIREGNGVDRQDGVFISRIQMGTVAESNGLLHVGDEILSVNSVMVGKLDDVVILMSIPRKLILKIRSKKNCNKKNASCPSLALMDQERDELPVVVLKKGHMRASSASELEMTEKIPDMFDQPYSSSAPQDDTGYLSKRFQRGESTGRPTSQYASIFITPHKAEAKLITGDEIGDSENSSEGSLPRSIDSGRDHYAGHRGYTTSVSFPEDHGVYLSPSSYPPSYPLTQSESLDREYSRFLQSERKFTTHQRSPSKASTLSHHGGSKSLSYASDSDRGAYSDPYQTMQDYVGYRGYNDVGKRFQGGLRELIHSKAKYGKNPRSRSPECYNSDSEVIYTHPRNQVTADSRGFASDYETYAGAVSDDEPVYSVPQIPCSSSTELQMLLKKFNNLSHELQQEQRNLQRQLSAREPTTTAPVSRVRPEGYYSDEYAPLYATAHPAAAAVTKSLSPVPVKKTAGTQTPGQSKLLRKHSADCLLSYRTYQLEDQIDTPTQEPRYSTALHMHASSKGQAMPPTISTSLAASNVDHSKTIDTNGKAITRNSASRFKDLQLAKRPLQIPYGEFDCYKADLRKRVEFARMNGFDGALAVHVLCGQGLKSTKMTLRDLYCVISVDSLNKARTMIRTGAVNFDWDEAFDIELENAKDVSFLIYNWDPNFKHRLCFHGSILLPGFLDSCKNKNIALKMEPKGLLYLTLLYKEPRLYLARRPSSNKFGLFGVDLDTVIRREAAGLNVPLLVVKCLAEVERRGIEVVGIYRLCGSSRRKAQLRDVLERGIVTVDLSAENVSDIHVVTGVMKDYLRELPEPLVTNALYQMLLDALSVRLPSDPDGSAKLMLSILECLPKSNQETMAMVLNHLQKVANRASKNKMALDQLAVCMGPVLLCPSPDSAQLQQLDFKKHIEVLKYLLEIWVEQNGTSLQTSGSTSPKSDQSQVDQSRRPATTDQSQADQPWNPPKPDQSKLASQSRMPPTFSEAQSSWLSHKHGTSQISQTWKPSKSDQSEMAPSWRSVTTDQSDGSLTWRSAKSDHSESSQTWKSAKTDQSEKTHTWRSAKSDQSDGSQIWRSTESDKSDAGQTWKSTKSIQSHTDQT